MKINAKYYNVINTTPKEIQQTSLGKIEIYSLNDYPELYNSHTPKGRFTVWVNKGGPDYKLLVEDEYYETLEPLYSSEINEVWLKFYNFITSSRKKMLLTILLPAGIILMGLIALINYVLPISEDASLYSTIGLFIVFFIINKFLTNKINKIVDASRDEHIDEIRNILTPLYFEELLTKQEDFVKEFYKKQYIEQYGEEGYDEKPSDEQLDDN